MYALQVDQLSKTYHGADGGSVRALDGISLSVKEGDMYALLGPNGAGKSTLISILTSLTPQDSGSISIFGLDPATDRAKVKALIGVVPQEFNFNIFETTEQILRTQAGYYGISGKSMSSSLEFFLEKLDLTAKRDTPAGRLSGGMKRRLMIARALIHRPRLLVLDEPTAGVDIELRRSMWDFVRELNAAGTTVILTTHYLEEAEALCNRVGVINGGRMVAEGSKKKLLDRLSSVTYVLETGKTVPVNTRISGFDIERTSSTCLEVTMKNGAPLNAVFAALDKKGIPIRSVKTKSSQLEELFLQLTGGRV